jgi:hypothetical protein
MLHQQFREKSHVTFKIQVENHSNKKKTTCLGTFTLITETGMLWKTMRQMCEMHEQTYLKLGIYSYHYKWSPAEFCTKPLPFPIPAS